MSERRRWLPSVVNIPKTTTILALGFLAGNLLLLPVLAALGAYVPADYRDAVMTVAALFKDGMLLILGFYFGNRTAGGGGDHGAGGIEIEAGYGERANRPSGESAEASRSTDPPVRQSDTP